MGCKRLIFPPNHVTSKCERHVFCEEHDFGPIDVWYDCDKCREDSCAWAAQHGYEECVSTYIKRKGSDNGAWVTANSHRRRACVQSTRGEEKTKKKTLVKKIIINIQVIES